MPVTYRGSIVTSEICGSDSLTQNLFTFENGSDSDVDVYLRRLVVQNDALAVLTTVQPLVRLFRASSISGGYIIPKGKFDSTMTSDPSVVIRSRMFETGEITASNDGRCVWQQNCGRNHTNVEQMSAVDQNMLPYLVLNTGAEFVLHPGEAVVVQVVAANAISNLPASSNWMVECVWEESSANLFAIGGTVTLNAVAVDGAKVMIIEADDVSMTNAHLRDVITTAGGGLWASTIHSSKVGAAFVQYTNGGTYYTAPGSPFLQE